MLQSSYNKYQSVIRYCYFKFFLKIKQTKMMKTNKKKAECYFPVEHDSKKVMEL